MPRNSHTRPYPGCRTTTLCSSLVHTLAHPPHKPAMPNHPQSHSSMNPHVASPDATPSIHQSLPCNIDCFMRCTPIARTAFTAGPSPPLAVCVFTSISMYNTLKCTTQPPLPVLFTTPAAQCVLSMTAPSVHICIVDLSESSSSPVQLHRQLSPSRNAVAAQYVTVSPASYAALTAS